MINKYIFLKLVLLLAVLDAFSIWFLIFFYITGIDVVFLVNVNFIIMLAVFSCFMVFSINLSLISLLFYLILVVSILKLFIFSVDTNTIGLKHFLSYFIGVILPIVVFNLTSSFRAQDRKFVLSECQKFAYRYAWIALPGLIVYSILYFIGKISYFGLGANLHYIYPFFKDFNTFRVTFIFFVFILISGKRAVLLNFIAQNAVVFGSKIIRKPVYGFFVIFGLVLGIISLSKYSSFFDRFDIYFELDFSDAYDLSVAFGGRFEEAIGILTYFREHPGQILFGSPPGAYYEWIVEVSNYQASKNYSHVAPLGFLFRYGIVFTLMIYSCFIYLLVKFWSNKNPLFIVYIGVLSSSFFGANLFIDPTSWLFIGLLYTLSKKRPKF